MNIAVYPHTMEIGGSQLNAIELGAAVASLGHDVLLVAEDGPLAARAWELGLEHVVIPLSRGRPSASVVRLLLGLVRKRGIKLVHGYEWPPAMECWLGPNLVGGVAAVATVMSGSVASFVPRDLPLVVGTEKLRRRCVAEGREQVALIEPPVDIAENSPAVDGASFRTEWGLAPDELVLVAVSRVVRELKLEGLISACHATGDLVREGLPVRLVIVGDGPARQEVESAAWDVNARTGSRAVVLTGELKDPRRAYASADVILGMGGSALRGMAFGKPLVVQGELGFWQVCDPRSVHTFLRDGWYGLGSGEDGAPRLCGELRPLLSNRDRRAELGRLSRALVEERFSLKGAARALVEFYEEAAARAPVRRVKHLIQGTLGLGVYKIQRKWARLNGSAAADDFNALQHMV